MHLSLRQPFVSQHNRIQSAAKQLLDKGLKEQVAFLLLSQVSVGFVQLQSVVDAGVTQQVA